MSDRPNTQGRGGQGRAGHGDSAGPQSFAPLDNGPPDAPFAASSKVEPRKSRWRWPRRLRITREGKYFIGITLGVGLAAINTGNNLLYLLLGLLLALIIVSSVMSELSLRSLRVTRRLPARAQVGRAHLVEIEVKNDKHRIPSYAIEVEDLRAGQPADKRCFFLKVSPKSAQVAAYRRTPAKRGRDIHTGFRLATRFPFGLFEKSREIEAIGELIIYPAVDPVRLPAEQNGRNSGGQSSTARGGGDEIIAVRPLREGDDPRDIYWRKSTLAGSLVLRERAREVRAEVNLSLNDVSPTFPVPQAWSSRFELAIRDVASRSVAHIRRGDSISLSTGSGLRVRARPTTGADPLLRFLALLEPSREQSPARTTGQQSPVPQRPGGKAA